MKKSPVQHQKRLSTSRGINESKTSISSKRAGGLRESKEEKAYKLASQINIIE